MIASASLCPQVRPYRHDNGDVSFVQGVAKPMGYGKGRTEGGHKRGHSNSDRWVFHQETKAAARKQRRIEFRMLEEAALNDAENLAKMRKDEPRR